MACRVFFEEAEVVPWLDRMRLPRHVMLGLFDAILGERANVTESDPVTTPGTETWRWGTRFCRDDPALRKLGWVPCRRHQLEGIRNDELGIKLVLCNTDSYTGIISKSPRNVAEKGSVASRLIENNSGQKCFSFIEADPSDSAKYDFWYFCIHASDRAVAAEISRPDLIVANIIRNFSERVFSASRGIGQV